MKLSKYIILFLFPNLVVAQFAPQAPISGHEGIHVDSNIIYSWATHCEIERGWLDIANTTLGKATAGNANAAIGNPSTNFGTVSLGDGGTATLSFEYAVVNGKGPDFVVFENAFPNPANPKEAFMELAFVEVSSDGINFVRFPAYSNTATTQQTAPFAYLDASLIHNLAGKYIFPYGTPFDLEDLKDSTAIDINYITHIRLVDVIGTIDPISGSKDIQNNLINDPYPTAFASGGFDLNGVGIIHKKPLSLQDNQLYAIQIFPNPTHNSFQIQTQDQEVISIKIFNSLGSLILHQENCTNPYISLENYASGMYLVAVKLNDKTSYHKIIKQ